MKFVADLLRLKPNHEIFFVGPNQSVLEAVTLMAEKGVGAVVVKDNGLLVGILTERDYARKIVLMERSSYNTPVRDIMTSRVITVSPATSTEECMQIMTERRLRHLPVTEGTKLVGLISIGDLVKGIISNQQSMIQQLESYIRGE